MAAPVLPPVIVVVGDVMVDVVVRPQGSFNPGSDTRSDVVVMPGGSAANQAAAAARAGADAHLVAVVGSDELGRAAARALAATGVAAHLREAGDRPTGTVVALVSPSGQRSMFTDRGANLCLAAEDVPRALLVPGNHLHLSGYDLLDEETRSAGLAVLEAARAAGLSCSVDPCSAGPLSAVGGQNFLAWTHGIDFCCANLDEGQALTGRAGPQEVVSALRRHYREVTLTLGPDGALYSGPDVEALHCPVGPVTVADTTGAGDAFTGTFLARRLAGQEPGPAVRAGLAAAAGVVARPGARGWA